MRTYETVFIVKPNLSADEHTNHIEFYKENITKHGGEILDVQIWGKQALAYPIENETDGFYVVIQFKAEEGYSHTELEKRFKFNEDVLRYVVVMIDEKKFKLKPRKEAPRKERTNDRPFAKEENSEETEVVAEEVATEEVVEEVVATNSEEVNN